jgi:hypothetical protein
MKMPNANIEVGADADCFNKKESRARVGTLTFLLIKISL